MQVVVLNFNYLIFLIEVNSSKVLRRAPIEAERKSIVYSSMLLAEARAQGTIIMVLHNLDLRGGESQYVLSIEWIGQLNL